MGKGLEMKDFSTGYRNANIKITIFIKFRVEFILGLGVGREAIWTNKINIDH